MLLLWASLAAQRGAVVAVALSGADSVALFDASSLAPIVTLPVGRNPHEIVASRDGRTLYVANAGGNSISVLTVFPRPEVRALWRLPDSLSVHDLVLDGGILWGVSGAPPVLVGLDTASGSIRYRHQLDRAGSWMVAGRGPEGSLVVANMDGGAITLVQPTSGRQTIHPATAGEIDAAATPDRTEIWSVNNTTGDLTIWGSRSGAVVKRMRAGGRPTRVVFTPDGKTALVPLGDDSSVVAYDVATRERRGSAAVGADPKVIVVSGDGQRAYVSHPRGALTMFDVKSLKVLRTIAVSGSPDGVVVVERE